jgi:photosystem II stability/assembly factor-like uncharacterized protein
VTTAALRSSLVATVAVACSGKPAPTASPRDGGTPASIARDIPTTGLHRVSHESDDPRRRDALLHAQRAGGASGARGLEEALTDLQHSRLRVNRLIGGLPAGADLGLAAVLPLPQPEPQHWSWMGPQNVGGRTRAILVDPDQPSRLWAASPSGGVWVTEDAGVSWSPTDGDAPGIPISTIVMRPGHHDELFAGTGEGFDRNSPTYGVGVLHSTDRGHTWNTLPSTTAEGFEAVQRLAFTSDGAVLLAATTAGVERSTDDGANWSLTTVDEDPLVYTVACNPRVASECIAGKDGSALYSEDGGATWKRASGLPTGRIELTYARANPNVVYAAVATCNGFLFRSDDGGRTYSARNMAQPCLGETGWYSSVVWAGDPASADDVIVGGLDLFHSLDGGTTLVQISDSNHWPNAIAHPDYHVVVEHPLFGQGNAMLYIGNDGGIYRIEDLNKVTSAQGWQPLDNGYGVTQFYSVAVGPHGEILGGTQDNATQLLTPNAKEWRLVVHGDGGATAIDPTDGRFMYAESQDLDIWRSSDGGAKWEPITGVDDDKGTVKEEPYNLVDAQNHAALFIAPFVLDPNDPRRLWAGGASLWRTDDARAQTDLYRGPIWKTVSPRSRAFVSAIAIAKGSPGTVWRCQSDGAVFRSADALSPSPTWTRVDKPNELQDRFCLVISIDPRDPRHVFLGFGGLADQNLWRTTDGGAHWTDASRGLPRSPVRDIVFHPEKTNIVYVATEVGVYVSEDGANSWNATNQGPTKCPVFDLAVSGGYLYAATFGRGIYRIKL